jgi:cobalt-zinc-cadmium efflux system membrane fusion protein
MNRLRLGALAACAALVSATTGCGRDVAAKIPNDEGTGPVKQAVVSDMDPNNFKVDHPERFPLVTASEYAAAPQLNVTGQVQPDIPRQVPVPSLASGKIVEIDAKVGDEVNKGQLLFKVRSTDVSGAFSDYRKAVKNEQLTKLQLNRAKLLYEDGAIPKSGLEVAQNAEDDAIVDLETAKEHLRILGSDPDHPTGVVEVAAPIAGVITDQQITVGAGVQALTPPMPFTISAMDHVWIVCDVYQNDLAQINLGDFTDIRLSGFPNRVWRGRIANIGAVLDANIRTAKVRIEVENPGVMRLGMFVTATFHGPKAERYAAVPATAILHIHDREWVYAPLGEGRFRRLPVIAGDMLPGGAQQVLSGVKPGDQVVEKALIFQDTVEQ